MTEANCFAQPVRRVGSKADLYREGLDRYAELPGALMDLMAAATLDDMVERLLRRAADAVTNARQESGCMISTSMIECTSEHADLASELVERRAATRDRIAEALAR